MASSPSVLSRSVTIPKEGLPSFTKQYIEQWCVLCTDFLAWEREHMLGAEPSPKEQEEHRQTLKWLLRLTRLIHSMAADPEFPEPSAAELLEVKLWQLDQSWKMIYEPMPKEEANRILAEVFPH
jgi:hypothetical protein